MQVPQEVRNHYMDVQHMPSEPVVLQHLLDLCNSAYTHYAMEKHPQLRIGMKWNPTEVEAAEVNNLIEKVIIEYSDFHPYPWMKDIEFRVKADGETSIFIPDDHQQVMEFLIDFRAQFPDMGQHSNVPSRKKSERH